MLIDLTRGEPNFVFFFLPPMYTTCLYKILRGVAQLVRSEFAPQRSPVRVPQTSGSLETYMVVNFRASED